MSESGQSSKAGASKTGKAMPKAAEASAGWPSVRAFLKNHPNLLREDPELMGELGLKLNAANIVEFGPAALARQIDAHRRESTARVELETTARANFAAQAQCHAGVIDILESRSNSDLARRLDETAQLRFGLVAGAVAVEGKAPAGWIQLDEGMVDMILGQENLTRLGETGFSALLFPSALMPVQSVAMIRLTLWDRTGLLAFGAADGESFTPEMGCELIAFIARVIERTAERWPVI
ncbi:MAG TPA: DUF484 family protein [Caulobacteraceae bacterium]|jgi:hypothetical protein